MSQTGQQRGSVLNVCKTCGQQVPEPIEKIPIALEKLRKEFGFGEKCKK